jgi:hypothetical protein
LHHRSARLVAFINVPVTDNAPVSGYRQIGFSSAVPEFARQVTVKLVTTYGDSAKLVFVFSCNSSELFRLKIFQQRV